MIRPIGDRVLLKRVKAADKTPGGIYLPDSAQEKPLEAIVVATGPGKIVGSTFLETTVKVNDKVLVGKYSGTELTYEGTEYVVIREEEIIGVLS